MNDNPSPCPISQLVAHSEEHFIDRRSEGPADETFEQLAARRADNMDLMIRFLDTLADRAQDDEVRDPVNRAIYHLHNARRHLQAAAGR